jgi:hypothetical protein
MTREQLLNNALCCVGDHWNMDGDYMCCRSCKRNLIASYDLDETKPPMRHAADCKRPAYATDHPWRAVRDALLAHARSASEEVLRSLTAEQRAYLVEHCTAIAEHDEQDVSADDPLGSREPAMTADAHRKIAKLMEVIDG